MGKPELHGSTTSYVGLQRDAKDVENYQRELFPVFWTSNEDLRR